MAIPKDIRTGDGGGLDMQLSNSVYNQLKKFAWKDARRREGRIHDKEEKSTAEQAVDPATKLLLFKMINNGILENVNGVISTVCSMNTLILPLFCGVFLPFCTNHFHFQPHI